MRTKSIATRSIRRARRHRREVTSKLPPPAAVQVFLFRLETYLGCELFDLTSPVTVGRHPRTQLRIDGDNISRHHCRFVHEEGELFIEDLGSSNGTFVNRMRVKGRMAVGSTDSIHIGNYTLKTRLVGAEPRSALDPNQAVVETRVEAVLSVDATGGDREAAVGLNATLDRRLYEAAVKRKTGAEKASEPVSRRHQLERAPGADHPRPESRRRSPETKQPETPAPMVHEDTFEDSTMMAASEISLSPSEGDHVSKSDDDVALDPAVEARLRDLDELIATLDRKQSRRASQVPWRDPSQALSAKILEGEQVDEELDETCEFARDLASSLGIDGRILEPQSGAAKVIPLDSRRRSTTRDRASFDSEEATQDDQDERSVPISNIVEKGPPSPRIRPAPRAARGFAPRPLPSRRADSHPRGLEARLLTPTEMRARVEGARPRTDQSESACDSSLYDDVWASRVEDTPAGPPPPPPPSIQVPAASEEQPAKGPSAKVVAAGHYDGVEIATRVGGRLADIAVLRKGGDQFILGHMTPQGSIAPAKAHVGLRLLRVNEDRTVDLVFPKDVAGHLVRGSATVMFSELTEGRKYSCLRLEARDVATVILGEGRHAISYHIRFLSRPKSLFRSLKGVTG